MNRVCKKCQRRLALLSARALDERDKAAALAHVNECADCSAYWERLQGVAALLRADAERSIEPTHAPVFVRPEPKSRSAGWLTLPRAIGFAIGVFVVCAGSLLFQRAPQRPFAVVPVAVQANPIAVLTIADSRRLVDKDLEAMADTAQKFGNPDFVFSVGSRYEGP